MRTVCVAALCFVSLLLAGCSASFDPSLTPSSSEIGVIHGSLHGGRQPIVGAHIFLFAAGTGGNAGPGISASSSNKSTSLLTSSSASGYTTAQDGTVSSPTYGDYYVTTNATGSFNISGEYTCIENTQIYMLSTGGNAGSGSSNSAAGMLAVLGQCPSSGNMASVTPSINMNEISTVAAAYAIAGYATDATHVSSSGSTLALSGIANAFANANQLYYISNGSLAPQARTSTPNGNGTVPQTTIHSLASSLAACVNSTGPSSTQCATNLFNTVESNGSSGSVATETATEAIYIAHNPGVGVSTIFGNTAGIGTPWLPALSGTPNDWTVAIPFTGGAISLPGYIALDAAGNAWIVNVHTATASLTELSPLGVPLTTYANSTSNSMNYPSGLTFDNAGNLWIPNYCYTCTSSLSEYATSNAAYNNYTGGGLNGAYSIVFDANNDMWIPNVSGASVSAFNTSGTAVVSGYTANGDLNQPPVVALELNGNIVLPGYGNSSVTIITNFPALSSYTIGGGLNYPHAVAIDVNGYIWLANIGDNSITALTSAGGTIYSSGTTGGGLSIPEYMAVDSNNTLWAANVGGSGPCSSASNYCISAFTLPSSPSSSNVPVAQSPSTGYTNSSLSVPYSLSIDSSGNIWVPNSGGSSVTEFLGIAAPVVTPTIKNYLTPYGSAVVNRP